jgi:CRP/FNR family cyclic AMP-dependent transcriptional regulator
MMTPPSPGRIVEEYREGENRIAVVEFDGKRRAIYLNLVPDAHVGDCVRFTAGFATERIAPGRSSGWVKATESQLGTGPADLDLLTGQAFKLLSELDPEQLRKLLPLAREKRYTAAEVIFQAGDRSSFLHLIVSGQVALEEIAGPSPAAVQTLEAGDAMGWSALTPTARTHFQARALTPVCTLAFPGEGLHLACERDPALGYALMKRLVELASERLDAMRINSARVNMAQGRAA